MSDTISFAELQPSEQFSQIQKADGICSIQSLSEDDMIFHYMPTLSSIPGILSLLYKKPKHPPPAPLPNQPISFFPLNSPPTMGLSNFSE